MALVKLAMTFISQEPLYVHLICSKTNSVLKKFIAYFEAVKSYHSLV